MALAYGIVIWFEIWVSDLERAKDFYGTLFGWSFKPYTDYDAENYWLIDAGAPTGVDGALVLTQAGEARSGRGTVIYVHVADLDQTAKKVEALGGSVTASAKRISENGGSFAMIADPDGNEVGLWVG